MQNAVYRRDIDGLRAVAVLAVLLYHFGIGPLRGGFVGVDVFFVISGFLITGIIVREVETGTFSILHFYERRLRRIVPALLVVIAASLLAGYILLLPAHFAGLGESSISAALGWANLYFFATTDYFGQSADRLPLLHTWSLGVEEQFYLAVPALLLFAARSTAFRRAAIISLGLTAAVSFVWSSSTVQAGNADAAFYLPHLRAWELALGSLLAFVPPLHGRVKSEAAAWLGAGLICYSLVTTTAGEGFPGVAALAPCLGAALLIWPRAEGSTIGRMLSLRPMVFVGKISYSLYLWHWPILVFYLYFSSGDEIGRLDQLALMTASFAMAWLSWRFVELPTRNWRPLPLSKTYFAATAGIGMIICCGGVIVLTEGMYSRLPTEARAAASYLAYKQPPNPQGLTCFITSGIGDADAFDDQCLAAKSEAANVLVIGDSHANHLMAGLRATYPTVNFMEATASGCKPLIEPSGEDRCTDLMREVFNALPSMKPDAIIVSARWQSGDWASRLPETLEYLRSHTPELALVGQNLEYEADLPDLLMAGAVPRLWPESPDDRSLFAEQAQVNSLLRSVAAPSGADFYDPTAAICDEKGCQHQTPSGAPILFDYNHFTAEGAALVVRAFAEMGLLSRGK